MLSYCIVQYFVEIHEVQTELGVFEVRGVANFGTQCIYILSVSRFLHAKQLLLSARLSHRNSVRPSVCLSHGWISQKRCKIGSPNLHHWLSGRI